MARWGAVATMVAMAAGLSVAALMPVNLGCEALKASGKADPASAGTLNDRSFTPAAADATATNPTAATLGQAKFFRFIAFSPSGEQVLTNEQRYFAPSGAEAVALWDVKTGRLIRRFTGHKGAVCAGAFSPDGTKIVTGGGTGHSELGKPTDTELRLWDVAGGREIRQYGGHKSFVWSVGFTPDGQRIFSADNAETARLWDVESGRELFAWPKQGDIGIHHAELSQDGRFVLTQDSESFTIWNASSGKEAVRSELPRVYMSAAHFSPDARLVASASYDKMARLWDAAAGKQTQLLAGHTSFVNQVRFSPDGKWVVTASTDKTARIWEVVTGKEIRAFTHPCSVEDVHFSPDSRRLVTVWRSERAGLIRADYLAGISLWDAQGGKELRRIDSKDDQCEPGPVVFTPDGKALLVHLERTELLDCETGKTIRDYK
jgi:WD40 repeat protein